MVRYKRIAMAIRMASTVGIFFHHCLFACCPGGRWDNMEQFVAQWQRPEASGVAMDMLHRAMLDA
jgi:hypothetical protein